MEINPLKISEQLKAKGRELVDQLFSESVHSRNRRFLWLPIWARIDKIQRPLKVLLNEEQQNRLRADYEEIAGSIEPR
jgi:predicted component of type VI protein secretion system